MLKAYWYICKPQALIINQSKRFCWGGVHLGHTRTVFVWKYSQASIRVSTYILLGGESCFRFNSVCVRMRFVWGKGRVRVRRGRGKGKVVTDVVACGFPFFCIQQKQQNLVYYEYTKYIHTPPCIIWHVTTPLYLISLYIVHTARSHSEFYYYSHRHAIFFPMYKQRCFL